MGKIAEMEFHEVVRIRIRGHGHDHKLIGKFMMWLLDNTIHPVFPATTSLGNYLGYFKTADAAKAREWLEEHNDDQAGL